MGIDISDAAPKQPVLVDEMQNFGISGDAGLRQIHQCVQHDFTLTQVAQGQLADDKRMGQDRSSLEQRGERLLACAKMGDPNRRIDQDHADVGRRRGGAFRRGSLPPSRASRRALSRSIRALSASRTRLDVISVTVHLIILTSGRRGIGLR